MKAWELCKDEDARAKLVKAFDEFMKGLPDNGRRRARVPLSQQFLARETLDPE